MILPRLEGGLVLSCRGRRVAQAYVMSPRQAPRERTHSALSIECRGSGVVPLVGSAHRRVPTPGRS